MRAIVVSQFGGPEVLELRDVSGPEPKSSEVLVNVETAGLNFADISMLTGKYPNTPNPPYVAGREFSGRILSTGERVMGYTQYGAFAERIAVPRHRIWPQPAAWAKEESAAFPVNFFTAYFAYVAAGLCSLEQNSKTRPKVLIHAVAGGVGTAAVQIGKLLGVEMYGTASSDEKLAIAKDLGLQHGINYTNADYEQVINQMTSNEGVDAAFEMLGGEHTARSMRCLKFRGHLVSYGSASGPSPKIDIRTLYSRNLSVHGLWLSQLAERSDVMKQAWQQLNRWIEAGEIRPSVGHVLPLEKAGEGFQLMLSRKSVGKIVLTL